MVVLYFIDILININFVSVVPAEVVSILNLPSVGLAELLDDFDSFLRGLVS
jgi:hypothetical protein